MTTAAITISILALLAATAGMFRPLRWAPAAAWCALAALIIAPVAAAPSWSTLLFWGAAAAIATAISMMLPDEVSRSHTGVAYMAGGGLAGTFAGMAMSAQAPMIIGAVIGVIFGIVAFSRTPSGKRLDFPSARFINYACAKGFPIAITSCVCGLAVIYLTLIIQSL